MDFRENYKKEMRDIRHSREADYKILHVVEDDFPEVDCGKSRLAPKWAAVAALVCGILLILNFSSAVSYADAIIGKFHLFAGGREMQLSEMTPIEIDLEKHMEYEKTELLKTENPNVNSYWCCYETQDLLQENTGLVISTSDVLEVQNVLIDVNTAYKTGHLSMEVMFDGKKYGMNGMFVLDGFDQDEGREYGYGERSAPYYVYEYGDGKEAYFVKDWDYKDLQKVYFSENGIMYQLFVEKSEEGKKVGERIVDAIAE